MLKAMMHPTRINREQGVATIELTIVLPLVLLLIFGVTELGRALVQYNTLTKAVRDGARYASAFALNGTTQRVAITPLLEQQIGNMVLYGNPAGNGSPVLEGLSAQQVTVVDVNGLEVRVEVGYPYQPLFGSRLPNFGFGSSANLAFTMQAAVTMRAL
jgi:Flp pilus assembly protein TadG